MQISNTINNAFLSIIENILSKENIFKRIFFANEMNRNFVNSNTFSYLTIVIILEGQQNSYFYRNKQVNLELLQQGDVFFVNKDCPSAVDWQYDCSRLGCGCNSSSLKMSWNCWKKDHKPCPPYPDLWYQEPLNKHNELYDLFKLVLERHDYSINAPLSQILLKAVFLKIKETLLDENNTKVKSKQDTYEKVLEYVNEHSHMDINRKTVADTFNLNPNYLTRLFSEHGNIPFSEYLNKLRLEKACELLSFYDNPIKEIARQCGYPDNNYFVKVFKKRYSTTPSIYRQKSQK